ncbi:MAG: class I SAM-dependent methyltransferase [Pseudomonadota bacterium]
MTNTPPLSLQSYADPRGRLFLQGGTLRRLIYKDAKDFYKGFIASDLYRDLTRDGVLIEAEMMGEDQQTGTMILEHPLIDRVSFAHEWSFEGLKTCALMMLDLQARLLEHGMSLHDGHSFNVLFSGCKPTFVDFTSIVEARPRGWSAYREFRHYVLNPLRLMAAGNEDVPRSMLSRGKGISDDDTELLVGRGSGLIGTPRRFLKRSFYKIKRDPKDIVAGLKASVEKLNFPVKKTKWGNYSEDSPAVDLPQYDSMKRESARKALDRLRPKTVLDVACNQGWYARLAEHHGARVVGFDFDEVAINKAFIDCRDTQTDVLPLVMDFTNPSPARGLLNAADPNAIERFKAEMVLAIAIVHHLVFTANVHLEHIVATLDALTEKTLLVEFIPKEDAYVSAWKKPIPEWYTLDNFKSILGRNFDKIEEIPSDPSPRVFLLCSR